MLRQDVKISRYFECLDWIGPFGLREIFLQLFTLRGFAAAIQSSVMSSEPTLRELPIAHHTESPRKSGSQNSKKNFQHFLGMRWILDGCLTHDIHDMSLFGGSVKAPISQAPKTLSDLMAQAALENEEEAALR